MRDKKPCVAPSLKNIYFSRMRKTGRRQRIHIPNTIHHVMMRGNNRQRIFYNAGCFERLIEIISESVEKFDHQLLCYCFMTNHVHLLIHIHNDELPCVMQYINYRYVRWFNHKYKKIGHLFHDRYRSIEVGNEDYLVNLCHYIHQNPIAAKMVKNLDDYPWSSHQYYITKNAPEWIQINFMLEIVKNKTQKEYIYFITEPVNRESWRPAMYVSNDGKIIFNEDVIHKFNLENNLQTTISRNFLPEKVICSIVCKHLNVDYQSLQCPSRNRYLSHQRMLLADFWMTYSNLSIVDIAKRFHRTHGTLSRQQASFHSEKKQHVSPQILEKIYSEINALL